MGDVAILKYPKKSHRKIVIFPKYSENLAEFFGIMMGDGGINNDWQVNITVNAIADADYSQHIYALFKKLFGIVPVVRKRKTTNALVITLSSTSAVDFLVSKGLIRGNKLKNGLCIPRWILDKRSYRKFCVRGLVDTDGCMFVHTHRVKGKVYKNIGFMFTSHSPSLLFQVASILEEFSIMPHISKDGKDIYVYQADSVLRYLKVFGTSNNRIKSVYNKWRDARVV